MRLRGIGLGLALSLALGGAALAHDFIVVSSTDPGVRTGQSLDAGQHLAVAAGRTVTVIRTSGEVVTLSGGPRGVTLPGAGVASADAGRFQALHALFQAPPAGRAFGARRGFCAPAASLTTLDAIIQADKTGCKRTSRDAFQTYLKAHGADGADTLYAQPAGAE